MALALQLPKETIQVKREETGCGTKNGKQYDMYVGRVSSSPKNNSSTMEVNASIEDKPRSDKALRFR